MLKKNTTQSCARRKVFHSFSSFFLLCTLFYVFCCLFVVWRNMKRCKASKYTWKITFRRCLCKYNILNALLYTVRMYSHINIYMYIYIYDNNKPSTVEINVKLPQRSQTSNKVQQQQQQKNCYVGIFICVIPFSSYFYAWLLLL